MRIELSGRSEARQIGGFGWRGHEQFNTHTLLLDAQHLDTDGTNTHFSGGSQQAKGWPSVGMVGRQLKELPNIVASMMKELPTARVHRRTLKRKLPEI